MKITCLIAIWAPKSRQTQMNYVLRINHTNILHSISLKYCWEMNNNHIGMI